MSVLLTPEEAEAVRRHLERASEAAHRDVAVARRMGKAAEALEHGRVAVRCERLLLVLEERLRESRQVAGEYVARDLARDEEAWGC